LKALQYSGGKDSLACLHMFRNDPDVVVVHVDTGSTFPHVSRFVRASVAAFGMKLHVAGPEISCRAWQDANGLPADVVPWDNTPQMRGATGREAAIVPYATCCTVNRWQPMERAIKELGADTVIRGSKACESKVSVPDGFVADGVTYLSPLWDWSEEDVFAYLRNHGVALPPQYAEGGDSLDCWCCTAYLKDHGRARFDYLKRHYPNLYAEASRRLGAVREAVTDATRDMEWEGSE
jgi:3'-phosphoadenosine 5'-phosphosulfate sulfotransferase (PAPS reductase)/FAD synthetase